MKRLSLSLLCVALSLTACAKDGPPSVAAKPGAQSSPGAAPPVAVAKPITGGTADARAREAIRRINPQVRVDHVGAAALPGFRVVVVDGQVVFVSDDGKHLIQGAVYDTSTQTNLGAESLAMVRRKLLASIPVSERIVFAPRNPKYTVSVFTDVECGYCRKLHAQIGEFNKQGIAVQYLAFPRMGLGSDDFKKMVSVWCATDKRQALTDAKNDKPVAAKTCKNPVTMEYDVGRRVGLTGTPMILSADGTELGGYVTPAQLRAALDRLAAGKAAPKSTAAEPVAAAGG
jgi:thiol:disulfide interchange protein DsbC